MLASIIIVNYNTAVVLKQCLESAAVIENMSELEIIIVDNCSGDDSKTIIESLCSSYKNVKAVFLKDKMSFSGANNTGVRATSSDILLIMNPDIIFTEPVLDKLIRRLEIVENLGAVSPALLEQTENFSMIIFKGILLLSSS